MTVRFVFVSLSCSMHNYIICLFSNHYHLIFDSIAQLFCSFIIISFVSIIFLVICMILSFCLLIMLSSILFYVLVGACLMGLSHVVDGKIGLGSGLNALMMMCTFYINMLSLLLTRFKIKKSLSFSSFYIIYSNN